MISHRVTGKMATATEFRAIMARAIVAVQAVDLTAIIRVETETAADQAGTMEIPVAAVMEMEAVVVTAMETVVARAVADADLSPH